MDFLHAAQLPDFDVGSLCLSSVDSLVEAVHPAHTSDRHHAGGDRAGTGSLRSPKLIAHDWKTGRPHVALILKIPKTQTVGFWVSCSPWSPRIQMRSSSTSREG